MSTPATAIGTFNRPFDTGEAAVSEALADTRGWFKRHSFALVIGGLLFIFALIFFWPKMVVTIHAGEEGVLWSRFVGGTDLDRVYLEGTHLIFPWNIMTKYDVRINNVEHLVEVLSTDGLEIKVFVAIRYRPMTKAVPQLHQRVGPDYVNRIIIPEVVTAVRQVMGKYRPEQLYTLQTDEMQGQIVAQAATQVRERFLVIDDVLIRRIELPPSVQKAIESKLNQEQQALEYKYRVDKELREAERKQVESDAIQKWMAKIGVNPTQLLQWKGIEATLELAKSNNAKVIVVGGRDGLPLILNTPGQ